MFGFRKRTFQSPAELWKDLSFLLSHLSYIRGTMSAHVPPAFRERLMMVVTQVNGCRHCRTVHARQLAKVGISDAEIHALVAGQIPEQAPAAEVPALVYALHWAEHDGVADPDVFADLVAHYGEEVSEAIGVVLRIIRFTNLVGNTTDYAVCLASCGYLGMEREAAQG
ncbi:MAG: carboxymuconolactone decarboxylase family protein [Deltaproteobacteria bacterium]|nr:carboxymuconolactone decarboxylase family protein [Deltaproteobacteria bacterium]